MSRMTFRQVVGVVVFAGLVAGAAPALAGGGPYEGVPATVSLGDTDQGRVGFTAAGLREGDVLFFVGLEPPDAGAEPLLWSENGTGDQVRWEATIGRAGTLGLSTAPAAFRDGGTVLVGVDRQLDDGSVLQTNLQLILDRDGAVHEGPGSVARIAKGFRLTLRPAAASRYAAEPDGEGRVVVDASDPALPFMVADAVSVEPFVKAEVMAAMAVGTLSGENHQNVPYTNNLCTGAHMGTIVNITAASPSATIISTDISYKVYHSVDISRVKVSGFRGGIYQPQTNFVTLYNGTSSGSNNLDRTASGLHDYDGRLVNYEYVVGCCNRIGAEYGYLDWWSITLYFTETTSPTIDLVADSISAGPTSIAAGGTTSVMFAGHVAGSGTVGGSFGIGIFLSPDTNITTGDVLLWQNTTNWATAPPDSFGVGSPGYSVTIPGGTSAGTYYLGMLVDHTGAITETNEANNVAWTPITVIAAGSLPNLHAVSCSVSPTSTSAGATVTFTSRGQNNGTAGASNFIWGIYLSSDATIDTATDTGIMALDVPGGWNAGYDSGDVPRSVTLPGGLADGTYYLGIYFDSTKIIAETNETDNYCAAMFTIGSGGGGGDATTWILPAAAAATGFGGANWTGQVEITNPGSATRSATLYYVPKGQVWPGSVLSGPHSIGPNQSWYINDPVGAMKPTTGLLYVVFDQAGPRANSRVFALQPDGSTYGQGIPGIPFPLVTNGTAVIAPVHSQPGVYHANLGLVHPISGSYTVEVSVYSSGGSLLGLKSYTRSQAWEQIDNLFADMGLGSTTVTGAWVKVRITSGQKVLAYISLVDDRTKDPTFLWDLGPVLP